MRQVNKLLMEIRILYKKSGIAYQPLKKKVITENSCQFCRHRMTFIQLTEQNNQDNFYYKCSKLNVEIQLADSCKEFERDFRQV